MKKLMLPLFAAFLLLSCNNTDEVVAPSNSTVGTRANNNQKVDICHNGHIINVSVHAIPAHLMHGDPIDFDGDGYFSGPNDCNMPEDCNDNDGSLTDNCCLSGNWCGEVTYFNIYVEFNEDCTANIEFNGIPCENGDVTWELLSVEDNVFTYEETDLCGINGCIVTVTVGEGSLFVSYDCTDPPSTGTLTPCE